MAEFKLLTKEERESFFAARDKFIEENDRKAFREAMQSLRKELNSGPQARKAFMAANPA